MTETESESFKPESKSSNDFGRCCFRIAYLV